MDKAHDSFNVIKFMFYKWEHVLLTVLLFSFVRRFLMLNVFVTYPQFDANNLNALVARWSRRNNKLELASVQRASLIHF